MEKLKTTISRVIFSILFIVYVFYRISGYYFESAPELVHKTPYGFLALIQYEAGNYKKASIAWRRHFNLSYSPHQIEEQRKYLIAKVTQDPFDAVSHFWLADLLFVQSDYEKAAEHFSKALEKKPKMSVARIGLASCFMALGEYDKSIITIEDLFRRRFDIQEAIPGFLIFLEAFEKYLNSPGAPESHPILTVHAYRFIYYFDKRKEKMVFRFADKAIGMNIEPDKAHFAKATIYKNKEEYEKSLIEYNHAITLNPRKPDYYARAAWVYEKTGNISRELDYLRKASELESEYPEFTFQLGKALMDKFGDVQQAIPYLKKSFEMDTDNIAYATDYGIALTQTGRFEEAVKVADIMISNNPENVWGYFVKGRAYLKKKKYNDALILYKKALEVEPNNFSSTMNAGFLLMEMGRYDEALSYYERARNLKPYDVSILYTLQYLYRRKGRYHEARNALKEILKFQPNNSGAQRILPYVERNINK